MQLNFNCISISIYFRSHSNHENHLIHGFGFIPRMRRWNSTRCTPSLFFNSPETGTSFAAPLLPPDIETSSGKGPSCYKWGGCYIPRQCDSSRAICCFYCFCSELLRGKNVGTSDGRLRASRSCFTWTVCKSGRDDISSMRQEDGKGFRGYLIPSELLQCENSGSLDKRLRASALIARAPV